MQTQNKKKTPVTHESTERSDIPRIEVQYHPKPDKIEVWCGHKYGSFMVFKWDLEKFVEDMEATSRHLRKVMETKKLAQHPVTYTY